MDNHRFLTRNHRNKGATFHIAGPKPPHSAAFILADRTQGEGELQHPICGREDSSSGGVRAKDFFWPQNVSGLIAINGGRYNHQK